jgi:hypothetical protein
MNVSKDARFGSNVKYKVPERAPLVLSDASGTFYISTY